MGTYAIFETKNTVIDSVMHNPDETVPSNSTVVIVPKISKVMPYKTRNKKRMINDPVIAEDISAIIETSILAEDSLAVDKPLNPNDIDPPVEPFEIPKVFNTNGVEVVPVYPGCEKMRTKDERLKGMNTKIGRLVQRKFNTDLSGQLGLTGTQRIIVQFKINQNGNITEVLSRAP